MARHGGIVTQKPAVKKTLRARVTGVMGAVGNRFVGSLRMPKGMKPMGPTGSERAK